MADGRDWRLAFEGRREAAPGVDRRELHPLARHLRTGLSLAVTHLGKQRLVALAAWTDPRNPEYPGIDDQRSRLDHSCTRAAIQVEVAIQDLLRTPRPRPTALRHGL